MRELLFERGKECSFDCFCKKVSRNYARDLYRRHARKWRYEIPFCSFPSGCLPYEPAVYDTYLLASIPFNADGDIVIVADMRIAQALNALVPELRRIVLLAYYQGLSDPEIARRLGVPRSTVQYHRRKALSQLGTMLEKYQDREG